MTKTHTIHPPPIHGWGTASLTLLALTMGLLGLWPTQIQAVDKLDRTVLPIPEPKRTAITELDARKATPPPRFEVKAPAGAPNVLLDNLDR